MVQHGRGSEIRSGLSKSRAVAAVTRRDLVIACILRAGLLTRARWQARVPDRIRGSGLLLRRSLH